MIQTITFIADDFKDADYNSNDDCPMARALKRYYPEAPHIIVGSEYAGISFAKPIKATIRTSTL